MNLEAILISCRAGFLRRGGASDKMLHGGPEPDFRFSIGFDMAGNILAAT